MPKEILIITLFVICLIVGYFTLSKISSIGQEKTLIAFAKELGYTEESHLAQYKDCWGVLSSNCGQVLYYTTFLNKKDFQLKINNISPAMELPQSVDGYTIFDINLITPYVLTINNISDSTNRVLTPRPKAYKWRFRKGGKDWVISFYEIANDGQNYKIDNQPIGGNIIVIMLRTK